MKTGFMEHNKSVWEVPERYQIIGQIGAGTYGQVCSAFDTRRHIKVAIKKLARPFYSHIHAKRTYRELRLLKQMNHENVIGLLDVFTPATEFDDFRDIYLVTDLMDVDLDNLLRAHQLNNDHVKFFVYQILRGLKYIHSAGIIHRDLKPSNIAVSKNCDLKILDFGLARHTSDKMTGYVASRWYRAPELLLDCRHYNHTVDIWSVGCIMAELITSEVLFPGTGPIDQLKRIMNLCGKPGEEVKEKISEGARRFIDACPADRKKNFKDVFSGASPDAIDLLERMLELDADKRPSATEALAHPYLSEYADPSDEPTAEPYEDPLEDADFDIEEWRKD